MMEGWAYQTLKMSNLTVTFEVRIHCDSGTVFATGSVARNVCLTGKHHIASIVTHLTFAMPSQDASLNASGVALLATWALALDTTHCWRQPELAKR